MLPDPSETPTLSPAETAQLLSVSKSTVLRAINAGELQAIRWNRTVRVLTRPLVELLERGRDA
jgi:excisionase family DNA binding protein